MELPPGEQIYMTFQLDQTNSHLGFSVKHMMISTVRGSFSGVEAEVDIDEQDLAKSSVTARIDVRSVQTQDRMRDDYLVGKNFFNPDQFPHLVFKSRGARVRGNKITVNGALTIRGVERPIVLDGTFQRRSKASSQERLIFDLKSELDREAYGLVFAGAVETVSVVVSKKVKLDLRIELCRN